MNELQLELSVMELFQNEGYEYVPGESLERETSDVLLKDDLRAYLLTKYAADGLTLTEADSIILSLVRASCEPLYDANKELLGKIIQGFTFRREDKSKKDLYIRLIDFEDAKNNIFKVVNQFEIQGKQELRIPDAVVFINGLPLVVIEFKSAVRENATIHNAYEQLTVRYTRDIPEIFKYNAFVVISDGVNNKYGSVFAGYDYFYSWRKIDDDSEETEGINSLYSMVRGLFRKERILAVVKDFIFFPDQSNNETKIVCRYPQFFAATKLFENIKLHQKPLGDGKGGTYFGATGCGKSYTMLFLTRMLMRSEYFKSPTIILITDRTDLDDQLSKTFCNAKTFIGDNTVESIESREMLGRKLRGRASGGVYLTTIQKFTEDLSLLSDRTNIICISDEAHRSQVNLDQHVTVTDKGVKKHYGFAKYLHDSLPNATYVGFTGTPIDATIEVFGKVVDRYTMTESVKDGITVNLVYEGRAAKVTLDENKLEEIEEYYEQCAEEGANEHQIDESKKAITHLDIILGDPDRLRAVAQDFVEHYENRVLEGSTVCGKAMFVCSNRKIAFNLYKYIRELRPEWMEAREADEGVVLTDKERKEIKPIPKVNLVMTRSKDDEKELWDLLGNDEYKKELDRQFKKVKSNFKIAIVVDMWLTGFDVPELDTMYLDKPVQQHTLIQTISRVNRVCKGKEKGLIVDYIGIKNSMNAALRLYTDYKENNLEEISKSVIIVRDTIEVLDAIFKNFNNKKFFSGTPLEQLECLNNAVEYVQMTKEMEDRFMAAAKRLKSAYNLCSGGDELTDNEREKIHFYFAVRSVLYKLTKGDAPDTAQMNAKVIKMVEEAIQSDGVTELFVVGKETEQLEEDIFSDEYIARINRIPNVNTKIKLLQRLLKKAIDDYRKVNKIKGVDFTKRMNAVVELYNSRRKDKAFANEVLDDIAEQLTQLLEDLEVDKQSFEEMNISFEEKAFFDILEIIAKKYGFYDSYIEKYGEEHLINLAKDIKAIVDDKAKFAAWSARDDIKAELKVDIILKMAEYNYPPVTRDEVYKEILEQAENFRKYAD
ncbi:MAG: type I restriction endonuclease subunit R [Clostridia bacterium]|nr:type I restriction endonuclease subunit R [Clostridia bacterium]